MARDSQRAADPPTRAGGAVRFEAASDGSSCGIASIVLANPGKLNAIDISMWQTLRVVFERLQAMPIGDAPIAVIVSGADGQFASGGDIAEFAEFRFDEQRLREFHEGIVGPALAAISQCDIPLFAQIDGACIGGGLEIAACCDIRICGASSRFGAPIARLGFPMAPGELQLMCGIAPQPVLREMLLEARLIDAAAALRCGLVHQVAGDGEVAAATRARAEALRGLSPQAARINKRSLRQIARGGPDPAERLAHYAYADSTEHREGVTAFINKRSPRFTR